MDFPTTAGTIGGLAGFLLLVFTPGAWITFGLPLHDVKFWARLFTGAALSPLVVCGEFYLLRAVGVPFPAAAIALVGLNLPALFLIYRNLPSPLTFPRSAWIAALLLALLCAGLMLRPILSLGFRIYSPHALIYSDPEYAFARGDLAVEDPLLAGVRLAYPVWPALVFQAVSSFLLNSPPAVSWVWVNLASLMVVCGFAMGITSRMGGGRLAQVCSSVCLTLGTNPVGYILMAALPGLAGLRLFGDLRYTPWITKFYLFSTMPLGLALIAALLYLLLPGGPLGRPLLITLGLVVTATGLLYPLVFPSACGVVGAKLLAVLRDNRKAGARRMLRRAIPFLIVVLLAGLATFAQLKYIGHSRQIAASPVLLSAFTATLRKLAVSAIVTLPLLAGLAIMLRNSWRNLPHQTLFLLGGAFASAVMHAVLFIPYWDNEYKLIFVVAMCLAVFPALALERAWSILPKSAAAIAFALAGALLFGPYLHRYASGRNPAVGPLEANGFYLQLQPQHPWSAICRAVRTMTPPESLLVVQNNEVYYPAMTSRSLYVPSSDRFYPGVTVGTDVLLAEVRANGYPILAQRRRVLNGLFDSPSTAVKEDSLHQLFRLNRPIAVVLEPRHAALLEWLRKSGLGSQVYQHEGVTLWLIRPPYRLDTHEETALGVASGNVDGTPLWNPRICCRNSRPNAPVGSA